MIKLSTMLLLAITLACPAPASGQAEGPPNVVIIFTDDQGYGDLSCYGDPTIHTPHLDRMAAEGMKLTQFYVASPVCSPSRAALLTGCYPKRVGMHEHVIFPPYNHGLHTDEVTIADMLGSNGYATGCFGKWHLGHREGLLPTDQGFDEYFGVPYSNDMSVFHRKPGHKYKHALPLMRGESVIEWEPDQRLLTKRCTEEAVAFIEEHADEPFFVYVPHSMPHIPLYVSEAFEGRSPRGIYGDVIEEIDWSVGQIRAALDRTGVADNTLVIFTTDNGPWLPFKERGGSAGALRGGKGSNWEGGQRVPFIAAWPGRIEPGSVCREIVAAMDLLPTIASVTGSAAPAESELDGIDVSKTLLGDGTEPSGRDDFVYYTSNGTLHGVRRGPWKLHLESGELYNVEVDIGEKWNKAEASPELVAELRALAHARDTAITEGARPVREVDRLPRVLLLGDSISMGYHKHVVEALEGEAIVVRPGENCAGTTKGVQKIEEWLRIDGGWYDVIHFNFGLHDLKRVKADGSNSNDPADGRQAEIDQYEENLRELVGKLKNTGATLVFATTTPYPSGVRPHRSPEDAASYNEAALRVMKEHGVAIDDLYSFALPLLEEIQQPVNVHFTAAGSARLAEEVVGSIREAIEVELSR